MHGNNLVLTLDARAQRVALQQLGNRCGAVVALEPATGKVLVLASSPAYDPNLIEKKNGFAKILHIRGSCGGESALLNRATDGLFTPGSTFKLVTVSAALDTGKFTPDSQFYDPGYCVEYGKHVSNAGAPDSPGAETFGNVTLSQGLIHSINSVFCNVGKQLGAGTILRYAKRYGLYSTPPLETPANERAPSGLYKGSHLFDPKDPATMEGILGPLERTRLQHHRRQRDDQPASPTGRLQRLGFGHQRIPGRVAPALLVGEAAAGDP